MKYDLYHDESLEGGYWHGVLLVPQRKREDILNMIKSVRETTRYDNKIELKGLKSQNRKFTCIRAFSQIATVSLMQKFKRVKRCRRGCYC